MVARRKLDPAQVYALARSVGLPPGRAELFTAIAGAESDFNPGAHNPAGADDSYGLWQINMEGTLGPSRRAAFGLTSDRDLTDPMVNARAMAVISSKGANTQPWGAFTDGRYRQYLPAAADARRRAEAAFAEGVASNHPTANTGGAGRWATLARAGVDGAGPAIQGATGIEVPDVPGPLDDWARDATGGLLGGAGDALGALAAPLAGLTRLLSAITSPDWWRRLGIGALGIGLIVGSLIIVFREPIGAALRTAAEASPQGRAVGAVT